VTCNEPPVCECPGSLSRRRIEASRAIGGQGGVAKSAPSEGGNSEK